MKSKLILCFLLLGIGFVFSVSNYGWYKKLMFLVGAERSGIVISMIDEKIYFPKTFNEQMAWIDEEVKHIIKYNNKYNIKKDIQEKGRAAYGKTGYTHAINLLFETIKLDPKNKAVLHEVCKAEQELISFLYDESGALSEERIYAYWDSYLQSYIAELAEHPVHYVLVKGNKKEHRKGGDVKLLGIYDSLAKLEDAYIIELQKLENRHNKIHGLFGNKGEEIVEQEKIMINAFDEFSGRWYYDVKAGSLFWRQNIK